MVETLLSTLGMPCHLPADGDEPHGREDAVYLVVSPLDDPLPERLAQTATVIALQEGCLGDLLSESVIPSPQASFLKITPPEKIEIKRRPTIGGSLLEVKGDLIGSAFTLLARLEEYCVSDRDAHGRFQWKHTLISPPEMGVRPLVSEYAHRLMEAIREALRAAGLPAIRKESWPKGKGMAACLTHDVDVVRRGKLPRGVAVRDVRDVLSRAARGQLRPAGAKAAAIARTATSGRDPYWTFDEISAMEKAHGFRSTYFFMVGHHHQEDAIYDLGQDRMRQLMRTLSDAGCEIGLHGSYANYGSAEALRAQKTQLESRLGLPVVGHRNHLLRFGVPDSWRAHEAVGFSYDATLGFADREGFRSGHAFPFRPYDIQADRTMDLLEVPLAVMDVSLSKYRRLRGKPAENAVIEVLEQTRAVGGLATLLWHNDTFYDAEHPGSASLYESALNWLSGADAYVAPVREIDRWWRARERVKLSTLADGEMGWRMEVPAEIEGLVLRLGLASPELSPRATGEAGMEVRRDGADYLLEFDRLPAGTVLDIRYQ